MPSRIDPVTRDPPRTWWLTPALIPFCGFLLSGAISNVYLIWIPARFVAACADSGNRIDAEPWNWIVFNALWILSAAVPFLTRSNAFAVFAIVVWVINFFLQIAIFADEFGFPINCYKRLGSGIMAMFLISALAAVLILAGALVRIVVLFASALLGVQRRRAD